MTSPVAVCAMKYYYPCLPQRLEPSSPYFDELDNNKDWIAEVKKNGWRCMVYRNDNDVNLWTRHQTLVKEPLIELKLFMKSILPPDTILDGELIHYRTKDDKGRLYLFDIIMLAGKLLVNLPLTERRVILEKVVGKVPSFIELSQWTQIGKKNLYHKSIEGDLNEGIVLKKLSSQYPVSDRKCLENPYWIKVKKVEKHVNTVLGG